MAGVHRGPDDVAVDDDIVVDDDNGDVVDDDVVDHNNYAAFYDNDDNADFYLEVISIPLQLDMVFSHSTHTLHTYLEVY